MAEATVLEQVVLGIVWKRGPCTSYAVCKEFLDSPSSHWSGSAGAVYPLLRRLDQRGLVRATAGRRGHRPSTTYVLTAKGRAALRRWLSPPIDPAAAETTYDPIRTRAYFLGVLTAAKRRAFAEEIEALLEHQVGVVEAECERYRRAGDEFSRLAMRGAVHEVRARLTWIRELKAALKKESS